MEVVLERRREGKKYVLGIENEVGEGERSERRGGVHGGIQFEVAEVEDQGEELDLRRAFCFLGHEEKMKEKYFEVFYHVRDERIHAVTVSVDRKKQRVAVVCEDFLGVRRYALFRLPALRGSCFDVHLRSVFLFFFSFFVLKCGFVYRHRLSSYRLIHLDFTQTKMPNQCSHFLRFDDTRIRNIFDLHVNIALNT